MEPVAEPAIYFTLIVHGQVAAAYLVTGRSAVTTGAATATIVAVATAAFPCFSTVASFPAT